MNQGATTIQSIAARLGNSSGFPIETPSWEFYYLIKELYDNIAEELELTTPFDVNSVLGSQDRASYTFQRALIESVSGGSHRYVSEGEVVRQRVEVQPGLIGRRDR